MIRRVEAGSELSRLVVLAHSRSAAQRMRRRIVRRLPRAQVNPQVTTIHGLALGLLRRYRDQSHPDWRLLRAPEQELRIRDLLEGAPRQTWPESVHEALKTRAFARQLREVLARARHLSLDPDDVIAAARQRNDQLFVAVGRFFAEYLAVGDLEGALDYAELVHRSRVLLADPTVATSIAASFDAVIADDVHEMDPAQVALLGDLALIGLPVTVLGDPQQRLPGRVPHRAGRHRGTARRPGDRPHRRIPGAPSPLRGPAGTTPQDERQLCPPASRRRARQLAGHGERLRRFFRRTGPRRPAAPAGPRTPDRTGRRQPRLPARHRASP